MERSGIGASALHALGRHEASAFQLAEGYVHANYPQLNASLRIRLHREDCLLPSIADTPPQQLRTRHDLKVTNELARPTSGEESRCILHASNHGRHPCRMGCANRRRKVT